MSVHASSATMMPTTMPTLAEAEFQRFRDLIYRIAGIHLADSKRLLVEGRLQRRLRATGIATFIDYFRVVTNAQGADELQQMVDALTTNETSFFRESVHFDLLARLAAEAHRVGRRFAVWSAAASTGEEIYSIAFVLAKTLGIENDWQVRGTDICTRVLEVARVGRYAKTRIANLPAPYLNYIPPVDGNTVAVRDDIRRHVDFAHLNLNETLPPQVTRVPLIFVRNVMIYFDHDTKRRVVERLLDRLEPGGHIVVGLAETLNGLTDRVEPVGQSAYRLVR